MWTPVVIGTAATVVAVPVYLRLGDVFGVKGLALASTLSLAVYTIVLGGVWYARTGWDQLRPLLDSAVRTIPVVVGAGIAAYLGARIAGLVVDAATAVGALTALLAGTAAAAGVAMLLAANLGDALRVQRLRKP
jgi:peptidoglycan biosynthesis protein MviN/MurJ (putative lipid II flippase)